MEPTHFRFGGGAVETILHPLVAVWMLIAIVLIFVLPRNKAIVPFFLAFFTIPMPQVLVVGNVHLTMQQILILTVLVRMAVFRARPGSVGRFAGGFNILDRLVVLWSLVMAIAFCIQFFTESQAWIRDMATLLESLGGYLAARFLIPDRDAACRMIKALAFIFLFEGACMISEQFTLRNVFEFAGGNWPSLRNGHVRSEGPIGGLYGATIASVLLPLFLWLWREKRSLIVACLGFAGATAMAFTSHASTTWMAYGASLLGLAFWSLRKQMRLIRWGIVFTLVGLHLVMHGPVWSLIEKIDVTGGSSNYQRYMLIDNCIRHFTDWFLLGYTQYFDWGFGMWDLCNQFVAVALGGGLLGLVLFISIYSRGFGAIGDARKQADGNPREELFLWCLGSALFANVVASFGINYVVYLQLALFALLSCISVATFGAEQVIVPEVDSARGALLTPRTAGHYLPIRSVR